MNYHYTAIGTIEKIALTDYKLENIPAKVDTGADSSAIWASNIAEKDGELQFTLFGPSSPYFSGKEIRTRKYSFVTVKNSFGHSEVRYKVNLRLTIAGRTIKANVNLANRAANRFPVLIGRRTLHGKFVVDVTKRNQSLGNHRVLMLINNKNDSNHKFAEALKEKGIDIERVTYDQLVFSLGGEGNRITIAPSGADVSDFGLVYFRTSKVEGRDFIAAAIAQYLSNRNAEYIDRSVNMVANPDKLYQYIMLADNGVAIPQSLCMLP
ncbi:MAG: RimK/LysX family protein, partial [Candidatus Saccharimonadales bacterium]